MTLNDRPPHKGYPDPEPEPYEIPRKHSTRPCPTGQPGITDRWVAYATHQCEGPFELCPHCLNWHDPQETAP